MLMKWWSYKQVVVYVYVLILYHIYTLFVYSFSPHSEYDLINIHIWLCPCIYACVHLHPCFKDYTGTLTWRTMQRADGWSSRCSAGSNFLWHKRGPAAQDVAVNVVVFNFRGTTCVSRKAWIISEQQLKAHYVVEPPPLYPADIILTTDCSIFTCFPFVLQNTWTRSLENNAFKVLLLDL